MADSSEIDAPSHSVGVVEGFQDQCDGFEVSFSDSQNKTNTLDEPEPTVSAVNHDTARESETESMSRSSSRTTEMTNSSDSDAPSYSVGVVECFEVECDGIEVNFDAQQHVRTSVGKSDAEEGCGVASGEKLTFSQKWSNAVIAFSKPIKRALLAVTNHAACHPYAYVVVTIVLALAMIAIGFYTNFQLVDSENELWTPLGSRVRAHESWIENEWENAEKWQRPTSRQLEEEQKRAGDALRYVTVIVHNQGGNLVTLEGGGRNFEFLDAARSTAGYNDFCATFGGVDRICPKGYEFVCSLYGIVEDENTPSTCRINGPSVYWFHNSSVFESQCQSDQDVARIFSVDIKPGENVRFNIKDFIGNPEYDADGTLSFGTSYATILVFPDGLDATEPSLELERNVVKTLLNLQKAWDLDKDNSFVLEVFGTHSFSDEFNRGIVKDIPLVPVIFVIMSIFTSFAFARCDWVHSRSLLGFGAVVCVLLSIMTGYGLLFAIGVPFTSLTQILPFVMFGIGLDDSFVLFNAYMRTDKRKDAVERIHDTVDEVGVSITMTTVTSATAFGLGCISSIPAIRWLCLYAFPTILIDFVYQVTFFIALIVLDERRIQSNRRDCLICCVVRKPHGKVRDDEDTGPSEMHLAERLMTWYADFLLRPWIKALVIAAFAALFAVCAVGASRLELKFDFTSVLPDDSYVKTFMSAMYDYANRPSISPRIYFRNVDQSDPVIQTQMLEYVDQITALDAISDPPFEFWLRDFNTFVADNEEELQGLSFKEKLDVLFQETEFPYRDSIRFDSEGNILASRVRVDMDRVDQTDVDSILAAFRGQRQVSKQQSVNQGGGDFSFFSYDTGYNLWEFLSVTMHELKLTTAIGIAAVSFMALLFVPHWSGILWIGPMIALLYIELMGVLQFAGVDINAVSYIALVMSIGLLVDFVMHIVLRYFESEEIGRVEKTKDVLRTMGVSILLGGLSTFLGTMPLALTTSEIFSTIFVAFIGIVTLGIGHGLILLPVLLSLFGPEPERSALRTLPLAPGDNEGDLFKPRDEHVEEEEEPRDEVVQAMASF